MIEQADRILLFLLFLETQEKFRNVDMVISLTTFPTAFTHNLKSIRRDLSFLHEEYFEKLMIVLSIIQNLTRCGMTRLNLDWMFWNHFSVQYESREAIQPESKQRLQHTHEAVNADTDYYHL